MEYWGRREWTMEIRTISESCRLLQEARYTEYHREQPGLDSEQSVSPTERNDRIAHPMRHLLERVRRGQRIRISSTSRPKVVFPLGFDPLDDIWMEMTSSGVTNFMCIAAQTLTGILVVVALHVLRYGPRAPVEHLAKRDAGPPQPSLLRFLLELDNFVELRLCSLDHSS